MTTTAAVQEDPRLPVGLLLRDLRAAPDGLSQREAARRLAAYGPNELQRRQRRHWLGELLGQLVHPAGAAALAGGRAVAVRGTLVLGPLLLVTNGGTSDSALAGVDAVGWR